MSDGRTYVPNVIHARQEAQERRHARRERYALQRRQADAEWVRIAYHESAHANVVTTLLECDVTKLWADPDRPGDVVGRCDFLHDDDLAPFNRATIALAGAVAEYLGGFTARIDYGDNDWKRARAMVAPDRIPAVQRRAVRLLIANWQAVQRVADALIEHGELSGDEVRRLVRQHSSKVG